MLVSAMTRRKTEGVLLNAAGSVLQSTMKEMRCATLTVMNGRGNGSTAVESTSTTSRLTPSIESVYMLKPMLPITRNSVFVLRAAGIKSCCEKTPFTAMASGIGSVPIEAGVR